MTGVASPPTVTEAVYVATRQTAPWGKLLGWVGVAGLIYLLVAAVSIISRGFSGLGGDTAHSLFAFADNAWVGLFVGILATVLIQSSSTTTAIAVTAVGAGILPLASAVPILFGANVGTTVTTTLIALGYIGNRTEYRRALEASSIHDFFNLFALLLFFPLELAFQPLQRLSEAVTGLVYGTAFLPDPAQANLVRTLTRPVVNLLRDATAGLGDTGGPLLMIVLGAALIFVAVRYLSKLLKLLKLLMVGRTRDRLVRAAGGNPAAAVFTGTWVTVVTQSSTVTTSILVPFAGAGILSAKQLYPITLGANVGTTFTTLLAAFAVVGPDARIGLTAALVHLFFNLSALAVIYGLPGLRVLPLRGAQLLAKVASERLWVVFAYMIGLFVAVPALVIVLVGVL